MAYFFKNKIKDLDNRSKCDYLFSLSEGFIKSVRRGDKSLYFTFSDNSYIEIAVN
jgi:hypothetical protein